MFSGRGVIYTRHHLSDEPHGQTLMALKFEMSHKNSVCTKLALLVKSIQGSLNLYVGFNS